MEHFDIKTRIDFPYQSGKHLRPFKHKFSRKEAFAQFIVHRIYMTGKPVCCYCGFDYEIKNGGKCGGSYAGQARVGQRFHKYIDDKKHERGRGNYVKRSGKAALSAVKTLSIRFQNLSFHTDNLPIICLLIHKCVFLLYNRVMKIGVYGGTFDPIHNGHIAVAKAVKQELGLDTVKFVVAADPPHKRDKERTSAKLRFFMAKQVLKRHKGLFACDIEIKRGGVSYTAETLEQIKSEDNGAELFFIMGADMLRSFKSWHRPERIAELASIVVVQRSGQEEDLAALKRDIESDYNCRVHIAAYCGPLISSTDIRERVKNARPIDKLVPYQVEQVIVENLLYQPEYIIETAKKLKTSIDEPRYIHSLYTARESVMLADRFGLDCEKARLCGLLHDCAKLKGEALERCMAEYGFTPNDDETENPYMIHSRLGALVANKGYGITDSEIIDAISIHTLGSADMTPFDEVIFLADKIEPSRDYRRIENIRKLAYRDLDEGVAGVIKNNIAYNESRLKPIHPSTPDTLLAIEKRIQDKKNILEETNG